MLADAELLLQDGDGRLLVPFQRVHVFGRNAVRVQIAGGFVVLWSAERTMSVSSATVYPHKEKSTASVRSRRN